MRKNISTILFILGFGLLSFAGCDDAEDLPESALAELEEQDREVEENSSVIDDLDAQKPLTAPVDPSEQKRCCFKCNAWKNTWIKLPNPLSCQTQAQKWCDLHAGSGMNSAHQC